MDYLASKEKSAIATGAAEPLSSPDSVFNTVATHGHETSARQHSHPPKDPFVFVVEPIDEPLRLQSHRSYQKGELRTYLRFDMTCSRELANDGDTPIRHCIE